MQYIQFKGFCFYIIVVGTAVIFMQKSCDADVMILTFHLIKLITNDVYNVLLFWYFTVHVPCLLKECVLLWLYLQRLIVTAFYFP